MIIPFGAVTIAANYPVRPNNPQPRALKRPRCVGRQSRKLRVTHMKQRLVIASFHKISGCASMLSSTMISSP